MDKWDVVNLVERGEGRAKIRKRVQDSGYFGEGQGLIALDKKSVQLGDKAVGVVTLWDKEYPKSLKNIDDPPVCLFMRGNTSPFRPSPCQGEGKRERSLIAVVGSRKISGRGREAVYKLVPQLIKDGFGIVSGLAFGIDCLAHEVCLDARGLAVAVLPTSLDQIYPLDNIGLAERIVKSGGCLISEYPPGTTINRKHFLERNRIMVGLAESLIVVEAQKFSGTTASANFALEQGKEVFVAVDENGEAFGEGAQELLDDGARALPLDKA